MEMAEIIKRMAGQVLMTAGIVKKGVDSTGTANLVMGQDGIFYCTHWARFGKGPNEGNRRGNPARTCKHRTAYIEANGTPVLATPAQVSALRAAPAPAPEAPAPEAPAPTAPKAKRGRPAYSAEVKAALKVLKDAGFIVALKKA